MMTQTSKQIPRTPRQAARRKAAIDRTFDVELFRALSDPTRLRLLACLAKCGRHCSVSEIGECCSVDLSVVSRHLAILAAANIVESHKRGRTVFYRVRYDALSTHLRELADAIDDCCPEGDCCETGACCCGN